MTDLMSADHEPLLVGGSWTERYRDARDRLHRHQKPGRGVALYSLYINRPLGRRIASGAHAFGLTPNGVTLISAALTTVALVLLTVLSPSPAASALVVGLLLLAYAFDSADGQLARLRGSGGTVVGELLDHFVDAAKVAGFHVAILLSAARFDPDAGTWPLVTACIFAVVGTASFFAMSFVDQMRAATGSHPPPRPTALWYRVAVIPTDYGLMCLWLFTRHESTVFFIGYAALAAANTIHLAVATRSRFREAAAIDHHRGRTS